MSSPIIMKFFMLKVKTKIFTDLFSEINLSSKKQRYVDSLCYNSLETPCSIQTFFPFNAHLSSPIFCRVLRNSTLRFVGLLVCWSVRLAHFTFLGYSRSLVSLLLPKWLSDLKYCSCPPACDCGSRVSGLVCSLTAVSVCLCLCVFAYVFVSFLFFNFSFFFFLLLIFFLFFYFSFSHFFFLSLFFSLFFSHSGK